MRTAMNISLSVAPLLMERSYRSIPSRILITPVQLTFSLKRRESEPSQLALLYCLALCYVSQFLSHEVRMYQSHRVESTILYMYVHDY